MIRSLLLAFLILSSAGLLAQSSKEKLRSQMINEKAPVFSLKNLEGENVSLSDLKGKTVILDFWATWCGPCIASFPGIQEVVNHFQDDESVAFLFIDTWENGSADSKTNKVRKFMEKKGYNFNVLMDINDKVVTAYGLEGIPTKIIIGPDGNIKFRKIGGGSSDTLVSELYDMIELTKGS